MAKVWGHVDMLPPEAAFTRLRSTAKDEGPLVTTDPNEIHAFMQRLG